MVQEIVLGRLIRQLGPAGRVLRELLRENADLRRRVDDLEGQVEARRTLKRRSPADWRFRVLRWEEGEQTFQPRGEPVPKTVPNLRLHIHRDDPSEGAPYWDVTSKRLQAALRPGRLTDPIQPGLDLLHPRPVHDDPPWFQGLRARLQRETTRT